MGIRPLATGESSRSQHLTSIVCTLGPLGCATDHMAGTLRRSPETLDGAVNGCQTPPCVAAHYFDRVETLRLAHDDPQRAGSRWRFLASNVSLSARLSRNRSTGNLNRESRTLYHPARCLPSGGAFSVTQLSQDHKRAIEHVLPALHLLCGSCCSQVWPQGAMLRWPFGQGLAIATGHNCNPYGLTLSSFILL